MQAMANTMNYIFNSMQEYKTGLSLFYPLIYSIVRGLETKSAFEFGAGWSTRVILDALKETGGYLFSISTDTQKDVMLKNGTFEGALDDVAWTYGEYMEGWTHCQGNSETHLKNFRTQLMKEPFDFVLHDGSHTEEVVFQDLEFILQKMKYNSILLVHDVLHSAQGDGMRKAVGAALDTYKHEIVTLPYGFGLSIIKMKDNVHNGTVKIKRNKPTSNHVTITL
jgi:predicted O-methyltransferase YrrM